MDRRVFILKDGGSPHSAECAADGDVSYCSLLVPSGAGDSVLLLHCRQSHTLLELNCVCNGPRSWLIGNSVESDGRVYVATPYDALFTVLHYLYRSRHVAQTVDQLLCDDKYGDSVQLCSCVNAEQLQLIADKKGGDDICAYMYSEQRTISWLCCKVRAVAECLAKQQQQRRQSCHDNATADLVTKSAAVQNGGATITSTPESQLGFACGIVSRYLPADITSVLYERLDIKQPTGPAAVTRHSTDDQPASKKACLSPDEDYTAHVNTTASSQPVLTGKQKCLAKSAVGTKSILSFFGKKKQ